MTILDNPPRREGSLVLVAEWLEAGCCPNAAADELRRIVALEAALSSSAGPAGETLWCESCGEAPVSVRLDVAGLCAACAKEQSE